MTLKKSLSRARVGFIIFIGVLITVLAIFLVGEKSLLFSTTKLINVNFPSAEGVKPGSFVLLSGYTIGTVTTISLSNDADSVKLTLRISEDVFRFLKSDSKAEIKQEGLVGNKIINLTVGTEKGSQLKEGDYIQGIPPFALMSLADNVTAITDTTKLITKELLTLLSRLNRGEGTAGKLLNDDAVYMELVSLSQSLNKGLQQTTTQLTDLSRQLGGVTTDLGRFVHHADSAVGSAESVAKELEILVHNLNAGQGSIGALLKDRRMYDSLLTLVGALTDLSYDAAQATTQVSRGVYAMRNHWLLGRVFAGDSLDQEPRPQSSYQRKMRDLRERTRVLDLREERLRLRESGESAAGGARKEK